MRSSARIAVSRSETALEGAELDALSQQVQDYQESIADRLGDAPPVPIVGYGTLEEKFRQLGMELDSGTITMDGAVTQFFNEMAARRAELSRAGPVRDERDPIRFSGATGAWRPETGWRAAIRTPRRCCGRMASVRPI